MLQYDIMLLRYVWESVSRNTDGLSRLSNWRLNYGLTPERRLGSCGGNKINLDYLSTVVLQLAVPKHLFVRLPQWSLLACLLASYFLFSASRLRPYRRRRRTNASATAATTTAMDAAIAS
eukprot:COSAG01_NODE_48669_length_379_cov_0.721429_1_plen_119_part_10